MPSRSDGHELAACRPLPTPAHGLVPMGGTGLQSRVRQDLFDAGCFKTAAMTVNSHRTWGGAQGRILRAVDRGTAEITN